MTMISLDHHFLKNHYRVSHLQLLMKFSLLFLKYPNKSCDLDPFPTLLLKSCIDQLIFPISTIINLSRQSGVVPRDFKQAHVNPLIKKQTLRKNDQNNYRPISNLRFLSKLLEKVVANRLHEHMYNYH